MTLESPTRAIGLGGGIDLKDDASNLAPVGIVGIGIEKARIGDGMLLVVHGQRRFRRGRVCDFWIDRGHNTTLQSP